VRWPSALRGIKNVHGRDHFTDPRFKEMMDHYGMLLTPPDKRFLTEIRKESYQRTSMVLPSIGDGFSGIITPYNGWMAAATAKTDPEYSARQQWWWEQQDFTFNSAGCPQGMLLPITDMTLPARQPTQLSGAFPGFGTVMRNSWTDPNVTYLTHRAGYYFAHYHNDFNSIVLYSKGAMVGRHPVGGHGIHRRSLGGSAQRDVVHQKRAEGGMHRGHRSSNGRPTAVNDDHGDAYRGSVRRSRNYLADDAHPAQRGAHRAHEVVITAVAGV